MNKPALFSHRGTPFFYRVVENENAFDIELYNTLTRNAWACTVTSETIDTGIPLDKVQALVKLACVSHGAGRASEHAVIDLIGQRDDRAVLQLNMRFGHWSPTQQFVLTKVNADRREKLELLASIATVASTQQEHVQIRLKSLFYSVMALALVVVLVLVGGGGGSRGTAFASFKPYRVGRERTILWEISDNLDSNVPDVSYSSLRMTSSGLAQVSILLHHSNCRKDVVFRVYLGEREIASVYDYKCGLFSIGTTTSYVHSIPVKAGDALSVKYVGGGSLYLEDSFMDVLMLPQ